MKKLGSIALFIATIAVITMCHCICIAENGSFPIEGEWYYFSLDEYDNFQSYVAKRTNENSFSVRIHGEDVYFDKDGSITTGNDTYTYNCIQLADNALIFYAHNEDNELHVLLLTEDSNDYICYELWPSHRALFTNGNIIESRGYGNAQYYYSREKLYIIDNDKYLSGSLITFGSDACIFKKNESSDVRFLDFGGSSISMILIRASVIEE